MLNFWNGHKTKILAMLTILSSAVYAMEWIDAKTHLTLVGLFGGSGLATLHEAVTRETAAVVARVETVQAQVAMVPDIVAETVVPAVVEAATTVAKETVAATIPPLIQLTGLPQEPRG